MILVDTSVWIDYFNGVDSRHSDALDHALQRGTAALGDMIYLEILQGFRSDAEFRQVKNALNTLDNYPLFGPGMPDKCIAKYRSLRKRGITVRKTIDVIIANFCIEHEMPLLFVDKDFLPFVRHSRLQTAIEI
jgi:predicted nucleic acid-binding protein